jgi:uncharacterized protein DUF4150
MKPVMTNSGGMCAAFPDTCKTPSPGGPVPIPYPNVTQWSDGTGSAKVTALNKETMRKGDTFRMSSGDEAGTAGGSVISNRIKGKSEVKEGYDGVKVEGKDIAYLLVTVGQNGSSAKSSPSGKAVKPGQTKVVLKRVDGKNRRVTVKARKYKTDRKGKAKKTTKKPSKKVKDAAGKLKRARNLQKKIKASEALGDAGAQNIARTLAQQFGGVVGKIASFSGSRVLDVVAVCGTGTIIVVEAKGGGSPLGVAVVAGVGLCLQGTPQYLAHIVAQMATSRNRAVRNMGKLLKRNMSKVKYFEARTKPGKDTVAKAFDP